MIETILVIGAVIACSIWLHASCMAEARSDSYKAALRELEILGARYARGDIKATKTIAAR
jgi:hypothetical protein